MMERLGMRQLAEVIRLGGMARLNAPLPTDRQKRLGRGSTDRHLIRPAIRQPCTGTIFQGAPVQNFYRSLACQSNDAAVLQIRNGTTHGLDRDGEIFGYVIARDGQFHLPPCFQRSPVKRKQEGPDLRKRGDAAKDQELFLGSREGLKRYLAQFTRELRITLREKFNPSAGIARKHSLLGNRFDRLLPPAVRDKEEIPRQHQIDDLSPPVRTD